MKVKVSNIAFSKNEYLVGKLQEEFPGAIVNEAGIRMSKDGLCEYFKDADAAIVGLEQIDAQLLDKLPGLKMVAKFGVGLDNIDINACKSRDVTIGWTGGVNRRSVAEMTLSFMLSLSRNIFITANQLKQGAWNKNGGFQLTGKTIGLIGFGHIGKELVALLKPFNCTLLVNDILDLDKYVDEFQIKPVSKEEIYRLSDFITIHTPLTNETMDMINTSVLRMMKSTCFLINTARGGIVNESDLKLALQERRISGAALDVYHGEPPTDLELLKMDTLICTPHTGGNSYEAVVAMGLSAIEHLIIYRENFNKSYANG